MKDLSNRAVGTKQNSEERERRIGEVLKVVASNRDGLTAEELGELTGFTTASARTYAAELIYRKQVARVRENDKVRYFLASDRMALKDRIIAFLKRQTEPLCLQEIADGMNETPTAVNYYLLFKFDEDDQVAYETRGRRKYYYYKRKLNYESEFRPELDDTFFRFVPNSSSR